MLRKFIVLLLLVLSVQLHAQLEKLNDYKYIIVNSKFDYLKKADQYQTSSLTKFLLKKNNFNVFLSDDILPKDLATNRCLAAIVSVTDDSGLFKTKSYIEFKDCYGNLIYKSSEGISRQKDFKRSYSEAIRNAYKSIATFKYNPSNTYNTVTETKKIEISKKPTEKEEVKRVPVLQDKPVVKNKTSFKKQTVLINVLYAQPTSNGYQLVNTKPEIVFNVLKTNIENVFIIKDKNGVFYKKDFFWIAEYYQANKKVSEKYQVKF